MAAAFETRLKVNNVPVKLNEFAHQYVTNIVLCAVSMLKGGQDVKILVFALEGEKASLTVNNQTIPLSPFPQGALSSTFRGMVSSLRGVDKVNSLQIDIMLSEK